ncbi:cation transporter [Psychromonas sp. Urea-02u-13]|uniref:cation transporter n=1 Tax=Psychromonas sp. Urea-02u-13 TaxID=2058326 RepID=UPI000C346FCB|nr:cation diffusion facilitator family transporter [Psychromonas sp. Urea-02u-13]PKG38367.1 cation transporter [Psychromonas sp. Urea-02u-13]
MAGCCGGHSHFDGMSEKYKRILWYVIAINGVMFFVEMIAGIGAQSQALQADALDFLGDTLTYGISLWAIGKSLQLRSNVALFKGYSLLLMALWVFGSTLYRFFFLNMPDATTMGAIALLAFAANVISVLLLMRYKDGDANVRSVWLCSRNDAIGNLVVLVAASGVWYTDSAVPDLLVAFVLASLFLSSAIQIIKQAKLEKSQQQTVSSTDNH